MVGCHQLMEGVNKLTDGKKTHRERNGWKKGRKWQAEAGRQEVDGG